MNLKNIPISYKGELHDVRLVNFTVEMDEVIDLVPPQIKIRDFNGRAMISLVNVNLKNMHPVFIPEPLHFGYRHVAFRLLVDDAAYNSGEHKGIFFLRSFTDKSLIVKGGEIFTNYNLEQATFVNLNGMFELKQKDKFLIYALRDEKPEKINALLKPLIGALDRAYSMYDDEIKFIRIRREKWPIEWINCYQFETNFFKTAKLEGAFKVDETIFYQWKAPEKILNSKF